MSTILFISEQTLKDRSIVNDNVDTKIVRFAIETAQDMYIHPILGTDLYERLKTGIDNDSLTANEETLLDDYIKKCLIWYTLSELPVPMTYKFYNKSVMKKGGNNAETISMPDMVDVINYYQNKAEWYDQRVVNYLKESTVTNKFPEYTNYTLRHDTIRPRTKSYTTNIYLGLDEEREYPMTYQGGNASAESFAADETYLVGTTSGAPTAGAFIWNLPITYQGARIRFFRETQLQSTVDPGNNLAYYDFDNSSSPKITVHNVAFGDGETLIIQRY